MLIVQRYDSYEKELSESSDERYLLCLTCENNKYPSQFLNTSVKTAVLVFFEIASLKYFIVSFLLRLPSLNCMCTSSMCAPYLGMMDELFYSTFLISQFFHSLFLYITWIHKHDHVFLPVYFRSMSRLQDKGVKA